MKIIPQVNKPTSKEPKGKGNKGKEIVLGRSGCETKASNTKSKTYFLENYKVQNLSGKCNVMKTMMLGLKEGEHVKVHCTKRTFNMEKDFEISVTVEDTDQLLSGAWLNISIIQIFVT